MRFVSFHCRWRDGVKWLLDFQSGFKASQRLSEYVAMVIMGCTN